MCTFTAQAVVCDDIGGAVNRTANYKVNLRSEFRIWNVDYDGSMYITCLLYTSDAADE